MIALTGRHIRAARALVGWSQVELSRRSKVALGTVKRMESFDGPVAARMDTTIKIAAVLEGEGVEFLNDGRPGVRLSLK